MPGSDQEVPVRRPRGTSPIRMLAMMRNSHSLPLLHQVLTRKKSDQTKSGASGQASGSAAGTTATNSSGGIISSGGSSGSSGKPAQAPRASPLMGKRSLPLTGETNISNSAGPGLSAAGLAGQTAGGPAGMASSTAGGGGIGGAGGGAGLAAGVAGSLLQEDGQPSTLSSEDLLLDNGSDTGTDEVDSGEGSVRTKQVIAALQAKIQKTREAIRKEQNNKESIVNEYLQMAADKTPTPRIKTLFEKKNQKSAQNIIGLQRKLEGYQQRLTEVETHGYTGHKQAKEVLRDVGQGLNTIVSKPKEFAHLIKNKFGSADNIAQLKLDDQGVMEADGKSGGTLPASFKYASDDENSSITSGSGPHGGGLMMGNTTSGSGGTQHTGHHLQMVALTPGALDPVMKELKEVQESNRRVSEVLLRQTEEFEDYRVQMQNDMSLLRSQLEDERFRVERLEEQLNDLTELHQHEILNLRQDLSSTEEKIEYRLDERTTDLSDLVDNTSTRISRLEQQQQQQQILSMEMVENATFRTIISKLINVVLALLAVVLVCVSTAAKFLSPFLHSTPRLLISLTTALVAWLLYHYIPNIQAAGSWFTGVFSWPWS
ncbi:hypothetical protein RRG08_045152 [Elysia crispata]|uniref:Transmembrane and coiled-coil domains protein 1 n=1 Tax=Elysia crispata TaxID=231223 RepID=A0AAE1A376_9GAST|nr:hypothetical protein RRG08_045152 [Elysia crispata]